VFIGRLNIYEVQGSHRYWSLDEELVWDDGTTRIVMPVGFVTDFASIPRLFWSISSPWDDHMKAAICHDYTYTQAIMSRKECDDLFYRQMKQLGVSLIRRLSVYWSTRLFGGRYYCG
jgi:hypothetical protein